MIHSLVRERSGIRQCTLICLVCALASFVPFIILDHGFFHVGYDFNVQEIPFGMALHNALSEGNPGGWIWNYGLGMSTVQAFSFYGMGSPFIWLSFLFPVSWYPYLTGWLYVLKYTVAGVTAYAYIRRFTKGETSAMAGALMYAFSGFQAANLIFFHFHDVVALFPILLIGLEKILKDPRDRGLFVFSVFLNALNNYYFFVLEVIFIILYFLFRFFGEEKKTVRNFFRDALNCLGCGIWGIAMSAVLLLPSVLYILKSPRAEQALFLKDLFWSGRWFLYNIRGFLLPGDAMANQSAFIQKEFSSCAAWLPVAGLGLGLVYCMKSRWRKGSWLSRIIPVLLLISASPLLSSGFLFFRELTYRWWFMLALLLALASAKVMETETDYPVKNGLRLYFILVFLFCSSVLVLNVVQPDKDWLYDPGKFAALGGIALGGIALLMLLHHFRKLDSRTAVALVCLFSAGTTIMTLACYRSDGDFSECRTEIERGMKLEVHDPQYRYGTAKNQIMLTGGGSGLGIFSSTIPQGERQFDVMFYFGTTNRSLDKGTVRGLGELFAGKYVFSSDPEGQIPVQTLTENGEELYVLERDACPIGFAVDHYILRSQLLDSIRVEDRGTALLYAAVIEPEEEKAVSRLCTNLKPEEIPLSDDLSAIVAKNTENRVLDFERDSRGFRCVSEYETDRLVWFSVPFEKGWAARIDGEEQEILPSVGMMLLKVPAGRHEIEFTYVTPGYTPGKIISLAACGLFVLWLLIRYRGRAATLLRKGKNGRTARSLYTDVQQGN